MSNSKNTASAKEFTCDLCGKQFETVTEMEDHKRNHAATEPIPGIEAGEPEWGIDPDGVPTTPVLLM